MKTQYYTGSSLDGFIATPDHSLDWLLQFGTEPVGDYTGFVAGVGAIAMGSHTYEWLLRNLINPKTAPAHPWPYEQPVWVFSSRTLLSVDGADLRFVRGDVRPVHEEMQQAAAGRNIWLMGGGDLAGQFHDHGLLDEIIVSIAPVTLGAGAPLLPRRITQPMRLLSAQSVGSGFAELRYAVSRSSTGPE